MTRALDNGVTTWWGADASPQHGQDWFLAAYSSALDKDIPRIWEASLALRSLGNTADLLPERALNMQTLLRLRMHRLPAVALGNTTLAKKVEVLLHATNLECGDGDLPRVMSTAASGTFDMGTEVGLMDTMSENLKSLLPEYLQERYDDSALDSDRPAPAEDRRRGSVSVMCFREALPNREVEFRVRALVVRDASCVQSCVPARRYPGR